MHGYLLSLYMLKKKAAMKNFSHPPKDRLFETMDQNAPPPFETMDQHAPPPISRGAFENVRLSGRNVGASMIVGGGDGEAHGSCSINIYINNDVQGVNNSLLLGSEVRMGDCGVRVCLEGLKLDRGFRIVRRNEGTDFNRLILLLAIVTLIVSIFACFLV